MTAQQPVPADAPVMIAWKAYQASEGYENTKRWAVKPEYTEGSLWAAFEEGFRQAGAELGRIREELKEANADKERLDWLDTLGSFRVALNRHDGRQRGEDADGLPVLLRLWLKDRSGENQSLRDALDELRPITEESVSGGALKEGATQ